MITLSMAFKVYRLYILVIGILILNLSAYDITYGQKKILIGIKAGATVSKNIFSDKNDNDEFTNLWKPGFLGTVLINFPLKNNFSFVAETGFSFRGRKIEFNNDSWLNNASYNFIDASMMLRKSFPINHRGTNKSAWFINVGPRVSYWLNGKGKVTGGGNFDYKVKFDKQPDNPTVPDFSLMYLTDINRWLFGLDIGIGVDAPIPTFQRFMFELRYTSGLTFYGEKNSAYNPTPGFIDNLRANEKLISLSITYALNRDIRGEKKRKSVKNTKPRKNIDSMIH